jgi:hypothetical protein
MGQMENLPRNVAALIYKSNIGARLPSIKWHKSNRSWQKSYLTLASIWAPAQQSGYCNARIMSAWPKHALRKRRFYMAR